VAGRSPLHRSPTQYLVLEGDPEVSRRIVPGTLRACCAMKKKGFLCVLYDSPHKYRLFKNGDRGTVSYNYFIFIFSISAA
jgi:hypothetical protein